MKLIFHILGLSILLANATMMCHLFYKIIRYGQVTYYEPINLILYSEFLLTGLGFIYIVFLLKWLGDAQNEK